MNEKHTFSNFAFIVMWFGLGFAAAGITAGIIYSRRSAGEITDLDRQRNQLNREYLERQSVIEDNQRIIGDVVAECIGYVETAKSITERTDANANAAIGDLRTAVSFIKQGIKERESLKNELNNLRAGLYRLRDLAGE
jgi:UDP-N-acetylglucosamine 2-epimerase